VTITKPSISSELLGNFRAAYARMWVRLRGANRDPLSLAAEIVLPILTIGAYVILYSALGFPASAGAAVIIGGAMIAFGRTFYGTCPPSGSGKGNKAT